MKHNLIIAFLLINISAFSQQSIPGEDFFGINQVIRVDFTFNQNNFWDSLVTNYQNDEYMMAIGLTITDNLGVHEKDSIAIKLKGNSSYGHPGTKKSFKIDINKYNKGSDYDGLKMLNFNNCFKDPTFMREKIFFDLCKSLGIPAPRVNYANVYMNGEFWGFYNVVEQVDDQFLDYGILDDNGNLFKAGDNSNGNLPADLKYYGANSTDYDGRYELKTNEDINDWSDLISLISWINNSSDEDFSSQFSTHMNKQKFLQSMALDNLFANLDAYINSARNYYIYHNSTTNLWEWIKWDGNESFGQYTGGPDTGNLIQLAPNYVATSRPLLQRVMSVSSVYQDYLNEYCSIKNNFFTSTYMNPRIDEIKNLIQSHVEADNKKMYTFQNFLDNIEQNVTVSGGPGGNQTVFGLKSFIQERNTYLQSVSCQAGIDEELLSQKIYPNTFENRVNIPIQFKLNSITDIHGKNINFNEFDKTENERTIELEVTSGIYFFTFEYQNNTFTHRLVKP
ncbi:MAG: CotH kinase family protein [Flavobacteriia bacterium]|nr:CotH kinase family protein [Flavobacteriia bacterium]